MSRVGSTGLLFCNAGAWLLMALAGSVSLRGQARTPWTTSRIEGSPEPAKPFVSEQVFGGLRFNEIVDLATVPGSSRLLVVERRGGISSFQLREDVTTADEILDLRPLYPRLDHAFGVALHPKFLENRQIYVCYALPEGQPDGSRVSRFTLTSLDPLRADPKSEEIILSWRSGGHNGSNLHFGPDGFLYITTGDGGPAAPPDIFNTGQDPTDLLGSILRIDVDQREAGKNYRIPPDNPWANVTSVTAADGTTKPVRPELWAYGLRNPWKMSFDRATGNLWCGDIGWELWEMVHLIRSGANYGWSAYEASQPIKPELASKLAPVTRPIVAHPHAEAASITGGYVYHGKRFPELANAYIYGDYITGKIWALWHDGKQITRHEEIADTPHNIISFAEDADGELYYAHYPGRSTLHRLARNPKAATATSFPQKLSETGLFADVARQQSAPGVYPFSITGPMWEDGAQATRYIALPDATTVTTTVNVRQDSRTNEIKADYATTWPKGAVLARMVMYGGLATKPEEKNKPIETQVLQYDGDTWNAYLYRWRDDGRDADLVPAEGSETKLRVAADPHASGPRVRDLTWRFKGRAECLRCHNTWNNGALAFRPAQLRGAGNAQLNTLVDHAVVDANFFEQTRLGGDSTVGPDASARALLQVNCATCHTAHSGGAVSIFLNHELLTGQMNVVGVTPTQGGLGLKEPKLIDPGDPWNSVLVLRMAKTGAGHMPLVGAREVDVAGLKAIEDWIARMPATTSAPKPWADTRWDLPEIERALQTVNGALRLRRAVDDGRIGDELRPAAFKQAWASPEASVRDIFERFKPDELREPTLGPKVDAAAILRLPGVAARGAVLLSAQGKLAACQACHMIAGQGRQFGPDLSRIGAQQTPAQILENILEPSKSIAELYRTTVLELRDGGSQLGFVRARGAKEILLTVPGGQSLKIPRADVTSEKSLTTSLMPEGQLQGLTPQEAADVIAYLAGLK